MTGWIIAGIVAVVLIIAGSVEVSARWSRQEERKMTELKPCPFCAGDATVIRTYTDDRQYQVFCGCGGRVAYFDTEEEAIEAWNRRAEDG